MVESDKANPLPVRSHLGVCVDDAVPVTEGVLLKVAVTLAVSVALGVPVSVRLPEELAVDV